MGRYKELPWCWLCEWPIEEFDQFPAGEYPWYLKNHADRGPIHEECGFLPNALRLAVGKSDGWM